MANSMTSILREKLVNFQQITSNLIINLKQEEYDVLDDLLNGRQKVIEEISILNYSQEDFKSCSADLRLIELENMLNKLLDEKKQIAREKIENVNTVKKANNNYKNNFKLDSMFFNKKI